MCRQFQGLTGGPLHVLNIFIGPLFLAQVISVAPHYNPRDVRIIFQALTIPSVNDEYQEDDKIDKLIINITTRRLKLLLLLLLLVLVLQFLAWLLLLFYSVFLI